MAIVNNTPVVKPGPETSEYKETQKANVVSTVVISLGAVVQGLSAMQDSLVENGLKVPEWLGISIMIGGIVLRAASTVGYQISRGQAKSAAKMLLLCTALSLGASGCKFTVNSFDEDTVASIKKSKDHNTFVIDKMKDFVKRGDPPSRQELNGIITRAEAENIRLDAEIFREEQKLLDETEED